VPASPGDRDIHQFAVADDVRGDVLDQDPQEFLAVGLRGRRRVPDAREVGGQGPDRVALGLGQDGRLLLGEPLVVRFQPCRLGERVLPPGFELRVTSRFSGSASWYWRRARPAA
jgi:hypothetical protein